jgi:hypothetical protein
LGAGGVGAHERRGHDRQGSNAHKRGFHPESFRDRPSHPGSRRQVRPISRQCGIDGAVLRAPSAAPSFHIRRDNPIEISFRDFFADVASRMRRAFGAGRAAT